MEFFDHHCRWLNNCIGAKNYFEFYGLLLAVFGLFSLSIGVNAYAISLDPFGYSSGSFLIGVTDIVLACVPVGWLIYLISLHTYLIVAKRSTIELILESRKRANPSSIAIKPHP